MRVLEKKISNKTKLLIILLPTLFFTFQFYNTQYKQVLSPNPTIETTVINPDTQPVSKPGLPLRLNIPILNINTSIQYVNLTPEGLMDVPSNYTDVAWYEAGNRPGEIGSAVIAGHYGTVDSVFNDLNKLKKGDELNIENDQGETISFIVNKIENYKADDDASKVFFSTDGQSHLNLITCEGAWNKATKSYPSRLIIFADMK